MKRLTGYGDIGQLYETVLARLPDPTGYACTSLREATVIRHRFNAYKRQAVLAHKEAQRAIGMSSLHPAESIYIQIIDPQTNEPLPVGKPVEDKNRPFNLVFRARALNMSALFDPDTGDKIEQNEPQKQGLDIE